MIDNQVKYAQSLIDDFSVVDKSPHIAVSVDMLDTGIDVPEAVNLIFFKIVRSKTKFWQMLGRGTRLCPGLFGPDGDKEFFYIFDYCENLEFFSAAPDGTDGAAQESIKQRVFKRRAALVDYLQQHEPENETESAWVVELRQDVLEQLHDAVHQMDVNNFIVRPHRRLVEEFQTRERWNHLTATDVADISADLSALPFPDEDDESARRFDLLILNLQLAILETSPRQERLQEQVRELAAGLTEKESIPAVAKHIELIHDLLTDEWWQDVTLPMLETVRRKLRDLIQFIDRSAREDVYTDFQDMMGEAVEVEGLVRRDASLQNYRLKVERFIREHENHVTIQRIKNNQPIQAGDIDSLEAMLFAEDGAGSSEDFVATYGSDQPLGLLVRQIIGLDQNAAKETFADFLSLDTLTGDQITFINLIIDHLVENGVLKPEQLFESPFTDAHDHGISGVLPDQAEEIVSRIESINATAMVT